MSSYKIFETEEFLKKLDKLSPKDGKYIQNKLKTYVYPQLRDEPFWGKNIKKLKGYDPPTWRYRIRNFRLFYLVDKDENIVFILTIDARKDAYK